MDYTRLGRSGLKVSRLCLGTMNFGPEADETTSFAIMDRAQEVGINFLDTANVYGRSKGLGATEAIIGRWFALGGERRERTVLATKVYWAMGDRPNDGGLSALNIRRACDASLRRLQTDHIDLYQMHHIDRATPWDEIWEAMEVLRGQGKILYVGSSNFAGWHLAESLAVARARGLLGPISEQSLYNLLDRRVELEVAPAAEHFGIGLIPWSPLKGGLLAGVARAHRQGSRRNQHWLDAGEALRATIVAYEDLCGEMGEDPATVALAWLLGRPAVAAPIIGPRTPDQLEGSLRALSLRLDPEVLARLDELFPGHRPAPEDYAW